MTHLFSKVNQEGLHQLPNQNRFSLLDHGAIIREKHRQSSNLQSVDSSLKWQPISQSATSTVVCSTLLPVNSACDIDLDGLSYEISDPYVSGHQVNVNGWVSTNVSSASNTISSMLKSQSQSNFVKPNQVVLIKDHSKGFEQASPNYLLPQLQSTGARPMKAKRRRWNYNDMVDAYRAVKERGMSLRAAAAAFCVPESTLRDRVHGRVSLECAKPGPATFFTFTEERRMVEHILLMAQIGYPFTRNQVVEMAGDMTKSVNRAAPFKYLNPSQAWFYAFVNRWPQLKRLVALRGTRTSNSVNGTSDGDNMPSSAKPAGPVTQEVIDEYYMHLDRLLTQNNIKNCPQNVWTVDEVCVTCDQQPPKILPQYVQRAQTLSYWLPTVALVGAASALGETVPPFIVFRGEKVDVDMMKGADAEGRFASSLNGWLDADIFEQWLTKHFLEHVSTARPILLLYDGHLQYFSVPLLDVALRHGVLLYPLPPHPAYNYCIEANCLAAFRRCFKRVCDRHYQRWPEHQLNKSNICPKISAAYESCITRHSAKQFFDNYGIVPFNSKAVQITADKKYCVSFGTSCDSAAETDADGVLAVSTQEGSEIAYVNQQNYSNAVKLQNGETLSQNDYIKLFRSLDSSMTNSTSNLFVESFSAPARAPCKIILTRSGSGNLHLIEEDSSATSTCKNAHQDVEVVAAVKEDACGVCGRLEPPQLCDMEAVDGDARARDIPRVIDWAQCDICNKWVHLTYCCDERCIGPHGSFTCPICRTP